MNTPPRSKAPKFGIVLITVAVVLGSGLWWHFREAHAGHHHDSHDTPALTLNEGKRWATDLPLRTGMQRIHEAVAPVLTAQPVGSVTPDQAKTLSATIQENVNYLIANCKLPPKADATLHVLIGDLLSGASLLVENAASAEGIARITSALRRYPEYFDHPDWPAPPAAAR